MYSTCLFCNGSLGSNEAIEHMPVGRRLAFDPSRGRLWVVCRTCERWNLSPFETRWEAIEDAERAFRATPMRISTDNIALAQLKEGTELVRIGAPPALEMAAWRYGDQFGRRRRKFMVLIAAPVAIPLLQVATSLTNLALASVAFSAASLAWSSHTLWRHRRDRTESAFVVRDAANAPHVVSIMNCRQADLTTSGADDWKLRVAYRDERDVTDWIDRRPMLSRPHVVLEGAPARRALGAMLPFLNTAGGSRVHVRDAVGTLADAPSMDALLHAAAVNREARRTHLRLPKGASNVGALPPRFRLALEMALHENDERRALEGELAELHDRWRDAELIASIADSLHVPEEINQRLEAMRSAARE